ncbi:MAG: hypothetical protein KDI36_03630, partial [Pseudomonadales bacterium]|nr:hypothetical protein [Pseudomonadales bacterium]
AGNIGAHDIRSLAENLELAARQAYLDLPSIAAIARELNKLRHSIAGWLATRPVDEENDEVNTSYEPAELIRVLTELCDMTANYNARTPDELIRQQPLFQAAGFRSELRELTAALEAYDFDAANDQLKTLMQRIAHSVDPSATPETADQHRSES